ncbi:MAG: diguanylate cyclase [Deltaproteobacteria bacterium]|nr:diguanylate cyclase [Deltaproteobacteria bacterium]
MYGDGGDSSGKRPSRRDSAFRTRAAAVAPSPDDRFQIISDTVLDAILMMDENGRIAFWNPAATRIFGYSKDEVLGKRLHDLLVPDKFHSKFYNGFEQFLQTGAGTAIGKVVEMTALRKDGSEFPVELALSPLKVEGKWWALGLVRDITERKRLEHKLKILAVTDGLTSLFNHRYCMQRLKREFDRSRRYGSPLSLLMMDIDHFKTVNDEHGHDAGDAVLQRLAGLFLNEVRKTDVVARYGGEEFVAILTETGRDHAMVLADRIRESVAASPFIVNGTHIDITISIGGATLTGAVGKPEELLKKADTALYAAKEGGRNRVEWSF